MSVGVPLLAREVRTCLAS